MKTSQIRTYLPGIACVLDMIALTLFIRANQQEPVTPPIDTIAEDPAPAPAEIKFNLSEGERRSVWNEYVGIEDKAAADAAQRYPIDQLPQEQRMDQLKKQVSYSSELKKQGKDALAKKYKLTDEQLSEIVKEALRADWPLPRLP